MREKKLWIVGAGMGGVDTLTVAGYRRLCASPAVIGAKRLLECVSEELSGKAVLAAYQSEPMLSFLETGGFSEAVFLVSGDTGFYSATPGVAADFSAAGWEVTVIPGISSPSFLSARIGRAWQDLSFLSCHGREADPLSWAKNHKASFFLLGPKTGVRWLCEQFLAGGLLDVTVWACENLGSKHERIVSGTPNEILAEEERQPFGSLCCAIVEQSVSPACLALPIFGMPDAAFLRGKVPMTKAEIRALSLNRLGLWQGAVCWDVGSGTGSVSVEMGLALRTLGGGTVYAVEKKAEAAKLTRKNLEHFLPGWNGARVIEGSAPEALLELEAPTHVFVGGSAGNMAQILKVALQKNPDVRIVANAITPETISELLACKRAFDFSQWEMVQVSVSTFREVGAYHLPQAENPVHIFVMSGARGGLE